MRSLSDVTKYANVHSRRRMHYNLTGFCTELIQCLATLLDQVCNVGDIRLFGMQPGGMSYFHNHVYL